MSATSRKTNPSPARKMIARKAASKTPSLGSGGANISRTQKAIEAAVERYIAANQEALLAALLPDVEGIEAMFAQIDRHLDAAERQTERLLAGTV